VVLNVDEDVVLLSLGEELLVVLKQLDCWLCDEDVDTTLDSVQSNWVVGGVWSEDSDFRWSVASLQFAQRSNLLALPLGRASIAVLYASGSVFPSLGNSSKDTSRPLYASEMFF
jgi:hypothetical protein